jgi:hypothetical protein
MAIAYGLAGGYTPQIDPNAIETTPPNLLTRLRPLLGNRDLALALLANSRGPNAQSFGQALGTSAIQADQMKQERSDAEFKRQYMQAQMAAMGQKQQGPSSVQEYQYARQNGYKGSYEDWTKLSGQTSRPSSVQEWEFYNALPKDQKQLYLEMKRNPNFQIKEVNQAPTAIVGTPGGGFTATPLSNTASEAQAAEQIKQAENRGGAVGKAEGEITGGIKTKGSNAQTVFGLIDEADGILGKATGSGVGAKIDTGAAFFGKSTEGAKATARLRVIQAGLMMNMPRMEGPQGEKDVELYQQAAAQVGDPNVPVETRRAALGTIRSLQDMYAERAGQPSSPKTTRKPTLDEIRAKYGRK